MDCDAARESIVAWIDRQLRPDEASALEAHLSVCAECRSRADALRAQDADLLRAFQPHRQAAQRIAEQVIEKLKNQPLAAAPPTRSAGVSWGWLLLAVAAGFLLAVLVFQPWKARMMAHAPGAGPEPPPAAGPAVARLPVARLVVATGDVEIREQGANAWQACVDPHLFQCPSGSIVRTGPDVRCELKTSDGCVVRLNDETEITLAAGNTVEIRRGQIWCSSPEDVSLKVLVPAAGTAAQPSLPSATWSAACAAKSCMITANPSGGGVRVATADCEAELQTPQDRQRLRPGETASIVDGQIIKSTGYADPILDTGWMRSLLIRKGHGDPELAERVDQLLARVGQSKLSMLYEQEIRGLGDYAALPLLRYVQSPISQDDPPRRLEAMRILADIAPAWSIADLVKLLPDRDTETRFFAAQALQRLTGLNHGRPPEQWRVDLKECESTIESWQRWWAEHHEQYPPPVAARSI